MADTNTPEYIILKDHLADVIDLLAGNAPVITQFSNHLFSSSLIPKEVHLNPKSSPSERATQLINSVLSTIGTHSDPSSVFYGLVTSFEKVGLTDMAKKLEQSLGVKSHIQPLMPAVAQSPTVIQLSSKDEVAQNIDNLYDQFSDLVTDLRNRFEELISEGTIKLIQVTRKAADYLRRKVTSLQADSIDELFDSLQPHYDFLNCSLLRKLTNKFLANDELQLSLSQYIDNMDKLLESSQLKHIRSTIKEKLSFLPSPTTKEHAALIVFKLHDRWEEMTLKNFKRVLSHYFGSKADLFSHIDFDYGSLVVKMLIPTSILQFVTDIIAANRDSMNRIGIFEVAINGNIVFSIDDTDIIFEKMLMDSRDDFEATMLLKLGASENKKSAAIDEGRTVLCALDLQAQGLETNYYQEYSRYDNEDESLTESEIRQTLSLLTERIYQANIIDEENEGIQGTDSETLPNLSDSHLDSVRRFNQLVEELVLPPLAQGLAILMNILRISGLITSVTLIGGVSGMAVTKLINDHFAFAISSLGGGFIGALAGTIAFDKVMKYFGENRFIRFRIAINVTCTLLGIGVILVSFLGAIMLSFHYCDYVGHAVTIFFVALMGAVSALTVGPEPIIGQISSDDDTRSSVGLGILRTCIGIGTGAMVGSVTTLIVDVIGVIPYKYSNASKIVIGGLFGAFIGRKYYSDTFSRFLSYIL